jgi:two-component system LytT family response regulator
VSPTNRVRTLIAEDEPLSRDGLAEWVRAMPALDLVAEVADGAAALSAIRSLQPALVLMDIQMPGMTGLQVMRALGENSPLPTRPTVIFTTAFDQHAVTAFELHAVDYLLKPYAHERFVEAILRAMAVGAAPSPGLEALEAAVQAREGSLLTRVLVRDQGKIFPLQVDAIEHLRSDTKYTAITSKGRSYLVRLPITSFEQRLDPGRFLKVNRSCIVNLDFVEAMTPDESSQFVVQLRDGTRVTASREVSKQLRADSL